MKGHTILCCTLLALTVVCGSATTVAATAAAPRTEKTQKAAATIMMEETSHDFGNIPEDGGPVTHRFTFTNTGTAPLVIISATASCGCTRPQFPQEPVKPGKSATIKVTYLPQNRPGEFDKSVKIRTNDPSHKKLTLKISGVVIPGKK